MRALDVPLLWQQLDGPQANAIVEGGRGWLKSWFLDKLNYFKDFSLATAADRHLDLIGLLMGVARPLVYSDWYLDEALKFWQTPTAQNNPTGYDSLPKVQGGVFDFLNPADRPEDALMDMDNDRYRFMLQTIAHAEGEIGSWMFVDSCCHAYLGSDYELSSAYVLIPMARPEDIYIYIKKYNTGAFVSLSAIMKSYVEPFPKVFIYMSGGG